MWTADWHQHGAYSVGIKDVETGVETVAHVEPEAIGETRWRGPGSVINGLELQGMKVIWMTPVPPTIKEDV